MTKARATGPFYFQKERSNGETELLVPEAAKGAGKKAKKEEKLKKKMGSEPPAADEAQAPQDPAADPKGPGAAA